MAQQYFIDTDSFLTASGIWLDQDLQTKAPNGFYAFNGVYRRMANGELLRPQQCPSCEPDPEPCGEGLSFGGGVSYPTTNIVNLGDGTGDVELTYEAFSIPDRFIVIWDGNVVIDTGYVGNPALFDFGGTQRSGFNSSLTGKEDPVTGTIYPDFTNFPDDGYPRVTSPSAGTVSFSKTSASPTTAQLDIYGPQSGTAWNATLGCPETPPPPPPSEEGTCIEITIIEEDFNAEEDDYVISLVKEGGALDERPVASWPSVDNGDGTFSIFVCGEEVNWKVNGDAVVPPLWASVFDSGSPCENDAECQPE